MPAPAVRPARHYAAFLSYRHADNREDGRRWAEWLHQALETYEVPRDLTGKPNAHGAPVPASLYPVFRDEEELPADADLSQNIRRALENSDLLIVLCSPRACGSRFVADEIRYFKELGRGDRILALIVDGEPNADDPGKAAAGLAPDVECFPVPLRFGVRVADGTVDWNARTEPIAADVRPQNLPGQGYTSAAAYRHALEKTHAHSGTELRRLEKAFAAQLNLARLKLVAGALGVPLGQLRERDAVYRARKFRRLAAVLGSFALLALAAAGVAVWQGAEAIKQEKVARRNEQAARFAETEAKQQKTRAETGEKAARAAQAEAMQQKTRAESSEKDALSAKERAVSAKKAAEELVYYLQYELRSHLSGLGSISLIENVNTRILRYLEEHPPDAGDQEAIDAAVRERAVALAQQGNLLLTRKQYAEAILTFQQSLSIVRTLVSRDPSNANWQHDLLNNFAQIGDVQRAEGKLDDALKSFRASLEIAEKFAAREPADLGWQSDLGHCQERVGAVLGAQNKFAEALKVFREKKLLFENLVSKHPDIGDLQRDLSISLNQIGDVLEREDDLAGALVHYQASLAIREKIASQYSDDAAWQSDLAKSLERVGGVLKTQGKFAAALKYFQREVVIGTKLVARDPDNADWLFELALGERGLGEVFLRQNQLNAARAHFEQFRGMLEKLVRGHSGDYDLESERAEARLLLAQCVNIQNAAGKKQARQLLIGAADILRSLDESSGLQPQQVDWLKQTEAALKTLN